jgi:hypothetical protein
VSLLAGAGTPTGNVTFKDGSTTFATAALAADGTANTSHAFLTGGTHNITAVYAGDAGFNGSTSPILGQQVNFLAPTANNDAYSGNEDKQLSVGAGSGVLSNDTDPNNLPLTAVIVTGPQNSSAFALNSDGSFSYTPVANFSGSDAFTYKASDGVLTSNTATVTITVNFVNDPPSFTLAGSNINASAAAGADTIPNWASNISPGPGANEASQTVSFIVTVAQADQASFSVQPAINASGTLTFTPSLLGVGQSPTVTVVAQDNGGTANGGQDQSAPQAFTITITP